MSVIIGGSGNDNLPGTSGDDSITGLGGDDYITGGAGNDTLDGGANGTYGDWVDYFADPAGVVVSLPLGQAQDGFGNTDVLVGIEHIAGSAFNDTLTGDGNRNFLRPEGGNDSVNGGGGDDVVMYESANGAIVLNLLDGFATGAAGNDTLAGIESAHATAFGDFVTLGNAPSYVFARAGDDTLVGGTGDNNFIPGSGDDEIDGGAGFDAISYDSSDFDSGTPTGQGVNVNLVTGVATDLWGDTDTFTGIEMAYGSPLADTLTGGNPLNGSGALDGFEAFMGNGGNDLITGGAGFDRAMYTSSPSGVNVTLGGLSNGTAQDGFGGTDTLSGIEEVRASSHADTLMGSSVATLESFEGRAGNDTINGVSGLDRATYSTSPAGVNVDLAAGTASDGWGGTDTLLNIDNVRGSELADTISGDGAANDLDGRGGNDSVFGGAGADTLRGGTGNDTLNGGSEIQPVNTANDSSEFDIALYSEATAAVTVTLGADGTAGTATGQGTDVLIDIEYVIGSNFGDVIRMTNRDNREIVRGGLGDDTLYGGHSSGVDEGFDHVAYNFATGSVTVNLGAGTASGADGNDVLSGFEGIIASDYADMLVGGSENGYFEPRGGNDTLDGGAGRDMVSYSGSPSGVNVDLAAGVASGGAGSDVFSNIESARGSEFADTMAGDSGSNELQGRAGNDTIAAGAGQDTVWGGDGDDSLDGGANDPLLGSDWLMYFMAGNAVNVNLATGTATGEGTDTFSNFEAVSGSAFGDTLTGDAADNVLRGNAGNDTIDGGAGNDWVDYGDASGPVTVSLASGTSSGADGADSFTNIERIRGSAHADSLTGNAGDNVLRGNAGNDTLNGGAGNDAADYYLASGPVTVDLASATASGADGNDVLVGIENAYGSFNHADVLMGSVTDNLLSGLGGDDSLSGSDGNDTLQGGAGNDTLDGGDGTDTAVFSGNFADYVITTDPLDDDIVIVTGPEGTDTLIDVEILQFADRVFANEVGTEDDDEFEGSDDDDVFRGRGGDDRVRGGRGNDAIYGDDGDDDLRGDEGDDLLDGGTGADTLDGGDGNDTYVIDVAQDVILEPDAIAESGSGAPAQVSLGGGIDRVIASFNYSLGSALENLTLQAGAGGLSGTGNALPNGIAGNESNNALTGAGGNDTIDGGDGIDTAIYAGARAQYTVTPGDTATVSTGANTDGTDSLVNVERLQFTDGKLAIDLDGNAGEVAKIIGIVFGQGAVSVPSLAGIGLSLRDGDLDYEALMGMALDVALGENASSGEVVTLLYRNLFGSDPAPAVRDAFAAWIDQDLYTPAGLAILAADIMGLPAAAQNGLAFS